MKKHAIIPIFISHRGCPHACVFCNQKRITARSGDVTPEDARKTIEEHLSTLEPMGVSTVEAAFFGGSFTGIPMDEQRKFLEVAKEYKDAGRIHKIHLSTRPDYIDEAILDNLSAYGADVIELGVQSFDEEVLRLSERGHTADTVYKAADLIKRYGFTLGIQLMIGLPGDSLEKCIYSARETVKIAPALARLYPTVVIRGTALYDAYLAGAYRALGEEEAVNRCLAMYEILDGAGINIIRVGLKSSDLMDGETAFHPAFRQLVEGRMARNRLEEQLVEQLSELNVATEGDLGDLGERALDTENSYTCSSSIEVVFCSSQKSFNSMFGHKGCNRAYFAEKYPHVKITYRTDSNLEDGVYSVEALPPTHHGKAL